MTTPDPGPVPERVLVDAEQVRRLVAAQLPQYAHLPVLPVGTSGWDNSTLRLGDELLVRLPTAAEYARAVDKEHRWLPVLAPLLPLPVPEPVARGVPGEGFLHAWSVYRWLDGVPVSAGRVDDQVRLATDLAGFLTALRAVDPTDGPQPGVHNWYRGGPLRTYHDGTQAALAVLDGHVDSADLEAAAEVWADALAAEWDGVDRWFHGDVAAGNLLVDDTGRLSAVIDFGTCGVGDPACDLAAAWTLLDVPAREVFRLALDVDDGTWRRGRGWALWKALVTVSYAYDDPGPDDLVAAEASRRVLGEIIRGRS